MRPRQRRSPRRRLAAPRSDLRRRPHQPPASDQVRSARLRLHRPRRLPVGDLPRPATPHLLQLTALDSQQDRCVRHRRSSDPGYPAQRVPARHKANIPRHVAYQRRVYVPRSAPPPSSAAGSRPMPPPTPAYRTDRSSAVRLAEVINYGCTGDACHPSRSCGRRQQRRFQTESGTSSAIGSRRQRFGARLCGNARLATPRRAVRRSIQPHADCSAASSAFARSICFRKLSNPAASTPSSANRGAKCNRSTVE